MHRAPDDPINFDPMMSNAFIDRNVHYQIYDSLVRIDNTGKIIPWLAEKYDVHANQVTQWRTQLLERAIGVFMSPRRSADRNMVQVRRRCKPR